MCIRDRYPGSIYWAALRRLQIVSPQIGSQANYFRSLQEYFSNHDGMSDDDKNTHSFGANDSLWHSGIRSLFDSDQIPRPNKTGEFDDQVSFDLTKEESKFLRGQFIAHEKDSLIGNVFEKGEFEYAAGV